MSTTIFNKLDFSRNIVLNDPRFHGMHVAPPPVQGLQDVQWNTQPGFKVYLVLSPAVKALRPVSASPLSIRGSVYNQDSSALSTAEYNDLAKGVTRIEITNFVKELSWSDAANQHYIDATLRLDNKNGTFNFVPQGAMILVYRRKPVGDHSGVLTPYLNLYVWERDKTADGGSQELTLHCYDRMYWLTLQPFETTNGGLTYTAKAKTSGSTAGTRNRPKGWTASQIITDMCKIAGVPIGTISKTTKIIVKPGETFPLSDTIANNIWDVLSRHIRGSITATITEEETNAVLQSYIVHMRYGKLNVERVLNPLAKSATAANYKKPINYFDEELVIQNGTYSENMSSDFATQIIVSKDTQVKSTVTSTTTSYTQKNTKWERKEMTVSTHQLPKSIYVKRTELAKVAQSQFKTDFVLVKIDNVNLIAHLAQDYCDWEGIPFFSDLILRHWVQAANGSEPDTIVKDTFKEISLPYTWSYPPYGYIVIDSKAKASSLAAQAAYKGKIKIDGNRIFVAVPNSTDNPSVDYQTEYNGTPKTTSTTTVKTVTKKYTFNPQDVYPKGSSPNPEWWQKAFGVIRKSAVAETDETPKEAAKKFFDLNLFPQRTFNFSCFGIPGMFHGDHIFVNSKYFGLKGIYLVQGIQYTVSGGQISMTITIYADRKTQFLNKEAVDELYKQSFNSTPYRF